MSQENVEIVRRQIDGWNRGDFEAYISGAHPDVEFSSAMGRQVEGGDAVYRGRDGARRYWEDWRSVFESQVELTEVRDLGDTVVALSRIRVKGRSSEVVTERSGGYVIEFEEGLVRRVRSFLSRAEALEAVGLSE